LRRCATARRFRGSASVRAALSVSDEPPDEAADCGVGGVAASDATGVGGGSSGSIAVEKDSHEVALRAGDAARNARESEQVYLNISPLHI